MEQQPQSNLQEPLELGQVNPRTIQFKVNDTSDNSRAQELSSTSQTQQGDPFVVNYGPCIICNINERCVLFVGCNHLACCGRCSTAQQNICPVANCNHPIRGQLHVFKP